MITSASKDDGIKILREQYGVQDVINHGKEDVVERVLALTDGQGADVVYDATYLESSMAKSIQTVKQGGSWIVLGAFARQGSQEAKGVAERKATLVHADLGRYSLGPERTQMKAFFHDALTEAAKWVEEGKLKPYINQTIKLDEAQEALKKMEQGKSGFGKVVVQLH